MRWGPLFLVASAAAALFVATDRSSQPEDDPVRVQIAGQRQIVFDWSEQNCRPTHAPDLPVRAIRDHRGGLQLLLSHFENFRLIGPSLDRLRVECRPVMISAKDADPRRYRDRQWLASPYSRDGRHIWALVHDEYQGHRHPGRCPGGGYYRCWYNAITLVVSRDGGRSYREVLGSGLVAGPPYRYRPGIGPAGVFAPSNLVGRGDGHMYALVQVADPGRPPGACLIRSARVGAPGSWRAWDGEGFGGVFTDPYRDPVRRRTDCELVAPGEIATMTASLTYNTALRRYLLLGMAPAANRDARPPGTGIYYSVSTDLVHWSPRRILLRAPTVHSFRCGGPAPIAYPSLVDPNSRSRTFTTTDARAYLYFTKLRYRACRKTPERDLVQVPVEISAWETE